MVYSLCFWLLFFIVFCYCCCCFYSFTAAPSGFPHNFSASVVTTHSLSLVWNPPSPEDQNGVIIRYRVNITVLGTMEMYQLLSVNGSITVLSLRPYTTYIFTIAAETAVGVGPFSGVHTVMTATDGKKRTNRQNSKAVHRENKVRSMFRCANVTRTTYCLIEL